MSVRRETAEKEQEKNGGFARQEGVRSYPKVSQRAGTSIL